jgi:pimeloyl-ACP methyl ester carboxylesterase
VIYGIARRAPWLLRLMLWKIARDVRNKPYAILSLFSNVSEADKDALADPAVRATFTEAVTGAFEQGTRGVALDWKLEASNWGFSLDEIRIPVHIWHGEQDSIQPIAHGKIVATAIPDSQPVFHPSEGHISLYINHYEEVLATLLAG